jgi:hypothetical protein
MRRWKRQERNCYGENYWKTYNWENNKIKIGLTELGKEMGVTNS